jgi:two-component system clock-associated histidine kinase SasA
VLEPHKIKTAPPEHPSPPTGIELLLFVDEGPISQEHIQKVERYLKSLDTDICCKLQVIDIREHPHLVEYYRLFATPSLVKIAPEPRQTLAGSNLAEQLDKWWPRWELSLKQQECHEEQIEDKEQKSPNVLSEVTHSAEMMLLSDEIFRLKQEKEELLEQLRFKDQILAMLAHDLRSPLTAASIAVETLELAHNQPDPERAAQLKEQLYQQTRKQFRIMNRLIADILQASKSMNVEFQVQHTQLYLQDLCVEILLQLGELFQEKSQTLKKDIPQDLPPVYADEELIRQVMVNLLENAIKYTPVGGKITVSILHRTSQKVQVSVCDTGPGIPEGKRERIFERHVRLKRDEFQEGYGLGLSVCRKIIGAHYGQIWVDSVLNQGSCFHFTLPVYRQ